MASAINTFCVAGSTAMSSGVWISPAAEIPPSAMSADWPETKPAIETSGSSTLKSSAAGTHRVFMVHDHGGHRPCCLFDESPT
ncbi:MAG: hypothetical protein KDN05_10660, partial [Verrucomicrobiae bacterium]|nr:hypothetical protein [Verrucomicrobiae bacterium]